MVAARDLTQLAIAERADFADLLESLTSEQWRRPSLCRGWSVRDVAAHVISYEGLGLPALAGRFVRGRLWPDRVNAVGIGDLAPSSDADLVALYRRYAEPTGLTAGFGGRVALTDAVIHQQDVRRPLGLPRRIPPERLRPVLSFALTAPPIRGGWRARRLRLVADDVDWTHGRGPEVRGSGEAVLMALAGRSDSLGELDGPGVDALRRRL